MKINNRAALRQWHPAQATAKWIVRVVICLLLVAEAGAQSPFDGMAFQSYLVNDQGTPVTGNKTIKFSIFDAESAGELKWSETQNVTLDSGNFSVILGQGQWKGPGIDSVGLSEIFNGQDRYIEISVGIGPSANVLSPRLRLLPSPYTFRAKQADQLSSGKNSILTVTDTGATANLALDVKGATTLAGTTASSLNVTGDTTLKNTTTTGITTLGETKTSSLNVTGATTLKNTVAGVLSATKITSPTYQFQNNVGLRQSTTFGNVSTLGGGSNSYEGYDIGGRYTFMSSSDTNVGVHKNNAKHGRGWLWHVTPDTQTQSWNSKPKWPVDDMVLNSNGLTVKGNIKASNGLDITGNIKANGDVSAKAYDMTVLTLTHPHDKTITWGGDILLKTPQQYYTKAELDNKKNTLGVMDAKFKINNPRGAICEFNFHWSTYSDHHLVTHLIITDDSDGSNNRTYPAKVAIGPHDYCKVSMTHYKKLSQGTHRVLIKYRCGRNTRLTPGSSDYIQIKLQVKVNGSADKVDNRWVVEKL